MSSSWLALVVIVVAGSLAALQAPMNAALGRGLGSSMAAATISFGVGFVALLVVTLLSGVDFRQAQSESINRWLLTGGLLGAFYVWAILWAVPTLGVLTAIAAMIFGQIVVALALDALGPFGLPVHRLSPQRILGACLVACGLVMTKL